MLWMASQPRSVSRSDLVNTFKVMGQQVTADARAAAEACALTYEMVCDVSGTFHCEKDQIAAIALAASHVSTHVSCTTAKARETAQFWNAIVQEHFDICCTLLTRETTYRCTEKALNSIEAASVAEQHQGSLDDVLSQVMPNTMNQRPTSMFSQVPHIPCCKNNQQGEQQQQQHQHHLQQHWQQHAEQRTEERISAWRASFDSVSVEASCAWRNCGSANQEDTLQEGSGTVPATCPSMEVQTDFGPLPRPPVHCTLQNVAQAASELDIYLSSRAAYAFREHCTSCGACGNAEQACLGFKGAKPFAAACWRYGRALAVGAVREEELLSDADLACVVCHHDCEDTALQGERLARLLSREHNLSSLAAILKTQDELGSRQKKEGTVLMDRQDVQHPVGNSYDLNGCGVGTVSAHDWDTLFSHLGWAGSCKPMRSRGKQWSQQQQGRCRAMGRGHTVLKRACNVREALDGGIAEELTGLTGDTLSIDSMTLSSLNLMAVQNRSRQRRTGAVKQSPPGLLDAPSAPTELATLNNSASCS